MSLEYVTVTWDEVTADATGEAGSISFAPNQFLSAPADGKVFSTVPVVFSYTAGAGTATPLVSCDSTDITQPGWYYNILIAPLDPGFTPFEFQAFINYSNGATQSLAYLLQNAAQPTTPVAEYLPLPSGTATAGQVPVATGNGSASAWGPVSGQYLCTPVAYAPSAGTALTSGSGGTYAAFSSASVNTGSFTAPASGSVVVTASFMALTSGADAFLDVALATHGTTTQVGVADVFQFSSTGYASRVTVPFLVTGLTAGTSYNFDLVGSASSTSTWSILASGAAPVLTSAGRGGPVVMTVQAV